MSPSTRACQAVPREPTMYAATTVLPNAVVAESNGLGVGVRLREVEKVKRARQRRSSAEPRDCETGEDRYQQHLQHVALDEGRQIHTPALRQAGRER